tara:strand:+ start:1889 stop:2056 length:168 start_codon:yes stop_codon:yes gene_type:complete
MIDPNKPGDKSGATIHEQAQIFLLHDLLREISENKLNNASQIQGLINNKLEDLEG